jgi:outer membrane biosynthesis protein TonB
MAEKYPRGPEGSRIVLFLLLSLILNGAGAVSGYWIKFPKPAPQLEPVIDLTNVNDAPPLLQPEDQPETPPDPEPTPPPEPEPTPPPLDKPPEFEIPEPTPTPTPVPQPESTPRPKPSPTPKSEVKKPPPAPTGPKAPAAPHGPNPPNASPNGVVGGTGTGGPRSSNLIRSPAPQYPPQALQMHITGSVRVTMHVSNGVITDAEGSGPPMLATAAARWVKANWKFAPNISGVATLPVSFVIH